MSLLHSALTHARTCSYPISVAVISDPSLAQRYCYGSGYDCLLHLLLPKPEHSQGGSLVSAKTQQGKHAYASANFGSSASIPWKRRVFEAASDGLSSGFPAPCCV